jgi:hypothetical protein
MTQLPVVGQFTLATQELPSLVPAQVPGPVPLLLPVVLPLLAVVPPLLAALPLLAVVLPLLVAPPCPVAPPAPPSPCVPPPSLHAASPHVTVSAAVAILRMYFISSPFLARSTTVGPAPPIL